MCVPISVATKGQVTGCTGICHVWPHVTGLVVLCAAFMWNLIQGFSLRKKVRV